MKRCDGVVRLVHQWIENGTLTPGCKAPSVRQMSRITGYSMSTVHNAYGMLESAGVFVAQPRSGFYIDKLTHVSEECVPTQREANLDEAKEISIDTLTLRLFASWSNSELQHFGAVYASGDLFPVDELNRHFRRILRCSSSKRGQNHSMTAQGHLALREAIVRRYVEHGIAISPAEIVLTAGGMQGINLCLNVLTKPGDTVLIESPSMFPIFTALEHRGLRAVEISYSPERGLDPDEFEYLIDRHNVRACVLMPTHHFPTGVSTPPDAVRRIVQMAAKRNLPIIENGGYMDLHYGSHCASTLKRFDEAGLVLQIGSFSNTLAPGYGIGWLVPGRFLEQIILMKFASNLISGDVFQRAIAEYMQSGSFDRHLRALRRRLHARMSEGLQLLSEYLPPGCRFHTPSGGFMCWVEGPSNFDAVAASRAALRRGVGLPPGPVFSVREAFGNFVGLNFSFAWDNYARIRLKVIGDLIAAHSR
ncbi:MAG: PLP-dependent aminotransferase family protein [Bradyrhizobiaceae bacterium]|nr:PLP-dependent aminotransferase family protein [Bradyrhizobiaceae bacterium]